MPTYQYACTACDERMEAQQRFTDAALTDCPTCEGRLRKVFSAVGVVFKGSGFYRTDSREAARSSSAASRESGSKEGSKESDSKSDSGSGKSSDRNGSDKKSSITSADSGSSKSPAKAESAA